jgi:hypothetical protein
MPTIYNTVVGLDGWIQHSTSTGAGGSWNATHDAATGTTADSNDSLTNESIGAWCTADKFFTNYYILRSYLVFSTSAISVAPSAATLRIYGYSSTSGDVIAIEGTWTGASSLSTGDWDSFTGYQAGWDSGDVTAYSNEVSTWSTSGYNDFTLNAAALAKMASSNTLSIVLMNHTYDYMDATPNLGGRTGCDTEQNGMYWSAYSATSKDPYIDYTSGGYANDTLGQDMDDEAYKVIGVESGDISKVIGA